MVEAWQTDLERREERSTAQGRSSNQTDDTDKQRREVLGLVHSGQPGRAMRRVVSHGVADAHIPEVQAQLRQKFPDRPSTMNNAVEKVAPINSFQGLKESLLSL